MRQHLQKSERVRLGGKYRSKVPKRKWLEGTSRQKDIEKNDQSGKVE